MANARLGKQAGGLVFALGVQALFALLLLFSMARPEHPRLARETVLLLRRAIRLSPPSVIDARMRTAVPKSASGRLSAPVDVLPPPATLPPSAGLLGLGQSLASCAPDQLDHLSAQALARCRREGRLVQPPRDTDLLHNPPSQSKDAARWAGIWRGARTSVCRARASKASPAVMPPKAM